ncbi:MAG: DUF3108 domain-containing protein [Woeseia sp.]
MIKNYLPGAVALASLLIAVHANAADHPLVPHEAEYRVKISLLRGSLNTRVEIADGGFRAQSAITPTGFAGLLKNGSIVERSEFVLTPDGIRPRHYESDDTLSKKEKSMRFDFDWVAASVHGQINGEDYQYPIDGQIQDRVSIQYELMHQLLHDEAVSDYAMLDGDEIKQLTVKNIGTRKVDVPFGKFEAVGIQHSAKQSSRVTTLWCVRELGYLPVIIEQHRDGKLKVRAELVSYTPLIRSDEQAVAAPLPELE